MPGGELDGAPSKGRMLSPAPSRVWRASVLLATSSDRSPKEEAVRVEMTASPSRAVPTQQACSSATGTSQQISSGVGQCAAQCIVPQTAANPGVEATMATSRHNKVATSAGWRTRPDVADCRGSISQNDKMAIAIVNRFAPKRAAGIPGRLLRSHRTRPSGLPFCIAPKVRVTPSLGSVRGPRICKHTFRTLQAWFTAFVRREPLSNSNAHACLEAHLLRAN